MNASNTPEACSAAPEFLNRDFEGRGTSLTHEDVPAVLRVDLEILNQDFDVRGARPPHLASDNSLELLMNAWNTSVARRTAASPSNPQIFRTPHELRISAHVPPVSRNTSLSLLCLSDVEPNTFRLPDASVARSTAVYNLRSKLWSMLANMSLLTSRLTRLKAV
ncbi:hypothetical protein C8J57DRAFT_1732146 [Mycena rebaudengoi]|nr:hypothetical protein C8J57DRAFT_1732146 [Mycena rebaudengoi]